MGDIIEKTKVFLDCLGVFHYSDLSFIMALSSLPAGRQVTVRNEDSKGLKRGEKRKLGASQDL